MTAEHFLLVEQVERNAIEQARIARVLGPTDCCTYDCNQGRNCPARSFPMQTGCSVKALPRPTAQVKRDAIDHLISFAMWLTVTAGLVYVLAATYF